MKSFRLEKKILDIVCYTILIFVSLVIIIPILWIIMSSLQTDKSLFSASFFPKKITFNNYLRLFKTDYFHWYSNTLILATFNMIFTVLITSISAYVFSRYKFKFKKNIMIAFLVIQMFPSFLALTAIYVILDGMKLLDSYLGLLLVYICGQIPYNTWLAKGFFDAIPISLDEAGRVDGAGHFTIFWDIIMPLAKPIMVFLAITSFMGPWFDFIFPSLLIRNVEKKTLAMGLFEWTAQQSDKPDFTLFACGSLLIAIPITALFLVLQKHIVKGLAAGSVKE